MVQPSAATSNGPQFLLAVLQVVLLADYQQPASQAGISAVPLSVTDFGRLPQILATSSTVLLVLSFSEPGSERRRRSIELKRRR